MKSYKVIGLMSGTSLDGLDIAYCHFEFIDQKWNYSILQTQNVSYSNAMKNRLQQSVLLSATELIAFHNEYGSWLGLQVKSFIDKYKLKVDFIASHGHTVFHQPHLGFTYQIGSGQHLANTAQQTVICDFRTNDVALGGQGAPLVPIGDQLLFSSYDFCLNLGGFSNFSFQEGSKRIAYDISPANMPLNYLALQLGKTYDANGEIAQQGHLNTSLLHQLNAIAYYHQAPPKSLGFEWFEQEMLPLLKESNDTTANLLHTLVHHIAQQISKTIKLHTTKKQHTLLITGGGARNTFLINTIKDYTADFCTIEIPDNTLIDYKEALIFAFMGVLKKRNEINCLQSVTGAQKDSSSGVIYSPS